MSHPRAGRDLDRLVAEKLFGFEVIEHKQVGRPDIYYKAGDNALVLVPPYSTHIHSAWEVVAKIRYPVIIDEHICFFRLRFGPEIKPTYASWFAGWISEYGPKLEFEAETAEHAICLAAINSPPKAR